MVCQATEIVEVILIAEGAKNRVPDSLKKIHDLTFYSLYDIWAYKGVPSVTPGHEQCPYCRNFDGGTFGGPTLRSTFPDHVIFDDDKIYVNYHKTLWNRDTCKCYLYRVGSREDPDQSFPL